MEWEGWIQSERRIRLKVLSSSPAIQETRAYRTSTGCGEICLCHETACPNCNGGDIAEETLEDVASDVLSGRRIRFRYRFEHVG